MVAPICKLTIVCPRKVAATLADALDAMDPPPPGYTMIEAEGRGASASLPSTAERVRGAIHATMFLLILPRDEVDRITETVRRDCPRPQIAYWVEPVEDYGRLI